MKYKFKPNALKNIFVRLKSVELLIFLKVKAYGI